MSRRPDQLHAGGRSKQELLDAFGGDGVATHRPMSARDVLDGHPGDWACWRADDVGEHVGDASGDCLLLLSGEHAFHNPYIDNRHVLASLDRDHPGPTFIVGDLSSGRIGHC